MSEYWRLRPNQEQLERLQKTIKKYGTQGVIKLPKDDKYEKFKKWFNNQNDISWYVNCHKVHFIGDDPFEMFEKEQEEKEKEITIKQTISYAIFNINFYTLSIGNQKKVTTAYNNIKNKDLLK